MSAALHIAHSGFDREYLVQPPRVRELADSKIDEKGLRIGVCRVIHRFEAGPDDLHLPAVGPRQEICK